MIGSRFYGLSWFGTQTIASAVFGLPVGFIVTWVVSLLTEAPPKQVQDLVASVRYPRSGQAYKGDPLGRDIGADAPAK
jgi:cation/acetate symporter